MAPPGSHDQTVAMLAAAAALAAAPTPVKYDPRSPVSTCGHWALEALGAFGATVSEHVTTHQATTWHLPLLHTVAERARVVTETLEALLAAHAEVPITR